MNNDFLAPDLRKVWAMYWPWDMNLDGKITECECIWNQAMRDMYNEIKVNSKINLTVLSMKFLSL